MRTKCLALAFTLGSACAGAGANTLVDAHARLDNFRVTFTDLAPGGELPALRFNNSSMRVDGVAYTISPFNEVGGFGDSGWLPYFPVASGSRLTSNYGIEASARLPGGFESLALSSGVALQDASLSVARSWQLSAGSSFTSQFTLSPHSLLSISATLSYDFAALVPSKVNNLDISGELDVRGTNRTADRLFTQAYSITPLVSLNPDSPPTGQQDLTVYFFNDSDFDFSGDLYSRVTLTTYYVAPNVPEPATVGLMLAGLALLGATAGRRRRG